MKENDTVSGALANLILCTLDFGDEKSREEARGLGIDVTPTFLVMNAEGGTIDGWVGYRGPEKWVAKLDKALADPTTEEQKQARFLEQPNVQDAIVLGRLSYGTGRFDSAVDYLRQAEKLDPQVAAAEDVPIAIFRAMYRGVGAKLFNPMDLMAQANAIHEASDTKLEHRFEIASRMHGGAQKMGMGAMAAPYIAKAITLSEGVTDEDLLESRKRLLPLHALVVEKDAAKAVALKKETLPDKWQQDANELNGFAWWCFENKLNLEEAEKCARMGVELAADDEQKANILDTLAEVVSARGNHQEAFEVMQKACKLNPESEYLQKQLTRFKEESQKEKTKAGA